MLFLYYMLILFAFSGASYCAVYLFIVLIHPIVKLNLLLLLCMSMASIACASYFSHCVILFELEMHLIFIH